MEIAIDQDVKAVLEFMQTKIEARKLVGVAESLRAIAPILWGSYERLPVIGIELLAEPINCLRASQSIASESAQLLHADDDFSGAAVSP